MAGTTQAASKGKGVKKVAPLSLSLYRKPPYRMSANAIERLIKGTCKHIALLSKQFANNRNWGYFQVTSLEEVGR